jgi:hypothetical protein
LKRKVHRLFFLTLSLSLFSEMNSGLSNKHIKKKIIGIETKPSVGKNSGAPFHLLVSVVKFGNNKFI